jgi:hypothetical protein
MRLIFTTAAVLRAVLCFIDPENTPKIAYDKDEYAKPLIKKIKEAIGEKDGSQSVTLSFDVNEEELMRQFNGVCRNIGGIISVITENTGI